MISYFIISLFATFMILRVGAHLGHDKENYGTSSKKSHTFTFWLRKKTGFDWHHIHIGFVLLIFTIVFLVFQEINYVKVFPYVKNQRFLSTFKNSSF